MINKIEIHGPGGMTLDAQMTIAATLVRSVFEHQKCLMPMVHAITKKGSHLLLETPQLGGTDEEKDIVAIGLRALFRENGVTQYVLMTEAWTLQLPQETDLGGDLPRPRDHADRVEVIALQGETKDGTISGQMVITRDAAGNPSLGELKTWKSTMSHGRLTGLLATEN